MARNLSMWLVVGGLLISWQSLLLAGEPKPQQPRKLVTADSSGTAAVTDEAARDAAPAPTRDFDIRVRLSHGKTVINAPRVRTHDGQLATIADETQTPFVIGESIVDGAKKLVTHVATEGTQVDVLARSAAAADYALLELTAEFKQIVDDESNQSGPFQTVQVKSNKRQVIRRVRLGKTTTFDFDDVRVDVIVTAIE